MTAIWVDTDFGFDDLWALLLLRRLECVVAGVSLVAGNAGLDQVAANASGAKAAYGFDWPVWQGARTPLRRDPETAERILGASGMRSRGRRLPTVSDGPLPGGALQAMRAWLAETDGALHVLALGPLTNIAELCQRYPEQAARMTRLTWMGGSAGLGNHTKKAEFNAFADAEAAAIVVAAGVSLDIVDLTFCRGVTFGERDLPETDALTGDLLGGYLDIALERGRAGMAIYDPLAALAIARPDWIEFTPCAVAVSTEADDSYGATEISPALGSHIRLSTGANTDLAQICLGTLEGKVGS